MRATAAWAAASGAVVAGIAPALRVLLGPADGNGYSPTLFRPRLLPMPSIRRRSFIGFALRVGALLGFGRALPVSAAGGIIATDAAAPFDATLLGALGAAVLPSELGEQGRAAALRRFSAWITGYMPGAEVNHPYPAAPVTHLPASPLPAWQKQLRELDDAAHAQSPGGFAALGVPERQALIAQSLAGIKGPDLPLPIDAPHVALGLMTHFFQSPQGTDLCYRAAIGKAMCRPLEDLPHAPRALRPEDLA